MRSSGGFTLIEALVVIAIIAVLASLLFPVVGKIRESSHAAACTSNQRAITAALLAAAAENNGRLPDVGVQSGASYGGFWFSKIGEYLKLSPGQYAGRHALRCPAAEPEEDKSFTYGINYASGERRVFSYLSSEGATGPYPNWKGSNRLSNLGSSVLLIADARDPLNPESSLYYSPYDPNYTLTVDRDGDGVKDSSANLAPPRKFNCIEPRHGDALLAGAVDGSIKRLTVREWAENPAYWGPKEQ